MFLRLVAGIYLIFIMILTGISQDIIYAEYFIDDDPGYGNANSFSFSSNSEIEINDVISVPGLSNGIHCLYIRAKDDDDNWSTTFNRIFYKNSLQSASLPNINYVEYFIDNDPGYGNANSIIVNPDPYQQKDFTIDLTGIGDGIHFLYLRAKDDNNNWSTAFNRIFLKQSLQEQPLSNIEQAEFFIDNDPGYGNGVPIYINQSPIQELIVDIDLALVENGLHFVYIRTKDENNNWSQTFNRIFYKSNIQSNPLPLITQAEYFINTDPGFGQGKQIPFTSDNILDLELVIDEEDFEYGENVFYVRAKDVNDNWSVMQIDTINIDFWNLPQHQNNGLGIQVVETDGANDLAAFVRYEYFTGGSFIKIIKELDNGHCFIEAPLDNQNSYGYKIELFDGNPNNSGSKNIGHIKFEFRPKYEKQFTRHAILLLHNDAEITTNSCFPYSENSPLYNQKWNYYEIDEYPVSMLVPPDKSMPESFNKQPILFIHGLNGSLSANNHPDISLTNNELSYWYTTNIIINERNNFHGWEYYYPFDTDIEHLGICLKKAVSYLHNIYDGDYELNLVTHSMGGLVTLEYLTENPSIIKPLINKVLFTVIPGHGSLGGNKQYETGLGAYIEPLTNMDDEAPAYRDLSLASEFIWNLHHKSTWDNIDLGGNENIHDDYFVLMGTTKDYFKYRIYRNVLHEESFKHTDGIAAMSSASLLDHGIGFATIPGNHDDGRHGQSKNKKKFNIGDKDLIPNIIESYFNNEPNSYNYFINEITDPSNLKYNDNISAVVDHDRNVLKPNGGATLENINDVGGPSTGSNEVYQKSILNFSVEHNAYPGTCLDEYKVFYNYNLNRLLIMNEINEAIFSNILGDYSLLGFFGVNKYSKNYYFFEKEFYYGPWPVYPYYVKVWLQQNSTIVLNSGINEVILFPFSDPLTTFPAESINIGYCETRYTTFGTGSSKSISFNGQSDTKMTGVNQITNQDSTRISFYVDDQTSGISFYYNSIDLYNQSIPFATKLQMPDSTVIDSSYTYGTYSLDSIAGSQSISITDPIPGLWQVWATSEFTYSDTVDFYSKFYLSSDIYVKNVLSNNLIPKNDSILISCYLYADTISFFDSISVVANISDPDDIIDFIEFSNNANQTDSCIIFQGYYSSDSVGNFKSQVNLIGKYNDYWFERTVYDEFEVFDTVSQLYIPDIALGQFQQEISVDLLEYLYCYNCLEDSISFNYNIIDNTLDTSTINIDLVDSQRLLNISSTLSDTGDMNIEIVTNYFEQIIVKDTVNVSVLLPDLVVENEFVSAVESHIDSTIIVGCQIGNSGNIYSNTSSFSIYLSKDSTIDLYDNLLADKQFEFLDLDSVYTFLDSITIPSCLETGNYNLIFVIDSENNIAEINESNNISTISIFINGTSLPSVTIGNDTILCTAFKYILEPGPGYSNYLWSDGSTLQSNEISSSGEYWIRVTAENGCSSADTIGVQFGDLFNLKVFLEGPFDMDHLEAGLNAKLPLNQPYNVPPWNYYGEETVISIPNDSIVDWILVELRKTSGDSVTAIGDSIYSRQAAFLLNNGSVVGLDGLNPIRFCRDFDANIYVVLWHRNHLNIMTAYPVITQNSIFTMNLSDNPSKIYAAGLALKELAPGVWGMIAADGNADGLIDNLDLDNIWAPQAGEAGYKTGDFNMDTEVDNRDKDDVWVPNDGKGSQIPE